MIRNRPTDEHRLQIRYGAEATWVEEHSLAFDIAGVDTTLVLGVHLEAGILIGLDPLLYDPLPMGISIEFKDAEVAASTPDRLARLGAGKPRGRAGRRRGRGRARDAHRVHARSAERYVRFEREATSLGLDPVLRLRAAQAVVAAAPESAVARHALEETFHLNSQELLEIIASRKRLQVAVRGGVAEHHLIKALAERSRRS